MLTVERIRVLRNLVDTLRQELLQINKENVELKEELKLNSELVQQLELELEEYKQNEKGLVNEVEQIIGVLEERATSSLSTEENSQQGASEYSPGY